MFALANLYLVRNRLLPTFVSNEAKRQSNADAESQLIAEARCPS
jgi:hypothetical protein